MAEKRIKLRFNMEELNELLRDFYTITKIRIVVFDDNFERLGAYPTSHSTYCEILRMDKRAKETCRACDLEGCKICKKRKKMYMYQCHAGLVEVVLPLMDGEIVIGYLMLGQVILEDGRNKYQKWGELLPKVNMYDIDFQALESCYWRKKQLSEQTLYAAAKIMETCASHLYMTKTIAIQEEDLSKRIEAYIERHLGEEVTVDEICDEFGIGRTKLYQITEHSFGNGIAQHIRKIRVRRAKELLETTDKKISEIAEEVGILDYNYFTKIFKKATGKTPRDYRKKVNTEKNG